MRVLHVADAIDPSLGGGTAERTFQLVRALRRADVECTILCTDHGLGAKRRQALDDVDLVAVPTLTRRFLVPIITPGAVAALVAQSDIVHITGHWSVLGAMASLAAQRLGRPYVYCPAGSLRIFGRSAPLKHAYNRLCGRRIVTRASRCLAVTELEREQFHEYGVSDSAITVLPNGVQPDPAVIGDGTAFRRRNRFGEREIILFLGRLSPIKGPDLLMAAFGEIASRHPSAVLVFAGPEGELSAQLHQSVQSAGLAERVFFTGFLAGQDKQDALAGADILVVPSRQEAMSLVALEAGLCATPVVLTDQCGFDEVQSVGGGIVTAVNATSLANAIDRLLGASAAQRTQMGERLRTLVLTDYTWDGICSRALALYANLIREAGMRCPSPHG